MMGSAIGLMTTLVDAALEEFLAVFGSLAPLGAFRRALIPAPPVSLVGVAPLVVMPTIGTPAAVLKDSAIFEAPAVGLRSPVRGGRLCVKHRSRSPHRAPAERSGFSAYRNTTTGTVRRSPPARTR